MGATRSVRRSRYASRGLRISTPRDSPRTRQKNGRARQPGHERPLRQEARWHRGRSGPREVGENRRRPPKGRCVPNRTIARKRKGTRKRLIFGPRGVFYQCERWAQLLHYAFYSLFAFPNNTKIPLQFFLF